MRGFGGVLQHPVSKVLIVAWVSLRQPGWAGYEVLRLPRQVAERWPIVGFDVMALTAIEGVNRSRCRLIMQWLNRAGG